MLSLMSKDLIPLMSSQKELPVVEAGLARGRELFNHMAKFEEAILDNTLEFSKVSPL